jgi:hypothetical protein
LDAWRVVSPYCDRFAAAFDPTDTMTVAEFTRGPAAHVELTDLGALVPSLMA